MIDRYVHECIIRDGDMAGNTHRHRVSADDIEFDNVCEVCEEPLAPLREVLAHVYRELTED